MNKILDFISKHPIYVILMVVLLLTAALLGIGGVNIKTDNSTYVEEGSKTYKDNQLYQDTFGGETMILQLESYGEALDLDTITLLDRIENNVNNLDGVFSYQSPALVVKNITAMQYDQFRNGIYQIGIGLDLVSTNIESHMSILENIDLDSLDETSAMITNTFTNLEDGQDSLSNGLDSINTVLANLSTALESLESDLENDGQSQDAGQVNQIHSALLTAQQSLSQFSNVPTETIGAMNQLEQNITQLLTALSQQLSQVSQLSDQMLVLSSSLSDMSDTLLNIHSFSDSFESGLPKNALTLENIIYDNGERRLVVDNFIIDDKYTMMQITLVGQVSKEDKQEVMDVVEETINEFQYDGEYLLSGKAVLDLSIQNSMVESMQSMLALSIIIMIIILLITFKVRWRILPLVTVLLAVIITIGLMGYLSIPVTMVSMAVFPILIGLGIDYAIQFQNRYHELLEEAREDE